RVAVLAAKLAAAVRVDGPRERQFWIGAAADEAARGDFKILYAALGFEQRAFSGEAGDANELGHARYSPFIRLVSRRGFLANSGGVGARDVVLQLVNDVLVAANGPLDQIANGDYARDGLAVEHRQVADVASGHQAQALVHGVLGRDVEDRRGHDF